MSTETRVDELLSVWQNHLAQGVDVPAAELCREHPELLTEMENRLQALRQMQRLADSKELFSSTRPTVATTPRQALPAPPAVEGYEILRELGRGGMGVVYQARQLNLNRIVALKMLLARGYASAGDLQRFLIEAEASARLQHPHIVQIFASGEHQGLPYIILEYVAGGSLADKVRKQPLTPGEAAHLTEQLARGMAYAHAQGIVHRDLKPENVLLAVGEDPTFPVVAKITDFGLAKRIEGDSGLTGTAAVMGTPSYMAPEQAHGHTSQVGPPADIYALGAILYRLLTGRPPFQAATVADTLAQVTDTEPVPPTRLQPKLARDLETICLHCLHKEPARRYATAGDLADDLRRYQQGEPIAARPITSLERCVKWVRRRPTVAFLSLLVVVVAGLGLAGIVVNWREAVRQERQAAVNADNEKTARREAEQAEQAAVQAALRAEDNAKKELTARQAAQQAEVKAVAEANKARAEAEKLAKVARFLSSLFEAVDPFGYYGYGLRASDETGQQLTAREVLDRGAKKIKSGTGVDPLTEATLADTIGNVYRNLGRYDEALQLLQAGLKVRRQHLPADHPDLATSLHNLGWWYFEQGNLRQAEKLYREALAIRLQVFGPKDPATVQTMMNLGWLLAVKGDYTQAEKVLRAVLAIRKEQHAAKSREVAIAQLSLAAVLLDHGELSLELPVLVKQATTTLAELEGDQSITLAVAHFQNGVLAQNNRQHALAVQQFQKSLEAAMRFLGKEHLYVAAIRYQLAVSLEAVGELERAEAELVASVAICRHTVSLVHPKSMLAVERLAHLLGKRQRAPAGVKLLEEALALARKRLESDDVALAEILDIYASFLMRYGDRQRAADMYAEAVTIFAKNEVFRLNHYYSALVGRARVLVDEGAHVAAEEMLRTALALEAKKAGSQDDRAALRVVLATALLAQGKNEEAVPWGQQALAVHQGNREWSKLALLHLQMSRVQAARGDLEEAEKHAHEGLRLARQLLPKWSLRLIYYLEQLTNVLASRGKHVDARPLVLETLGILQGCPLPNVFHQADCLRRLALLDLACGSHAEFRQWCAKLAVLADKHNEDTVTASLLATMAVLPEGASDLDKWCVTAQDLVSRHADNAAYLDAAGALLCACGKHDEAIARLMLAQQKQEAAVPARNAALLARAHALAKHPEEARQWLALAQKLVGNKTSVRGPAVSQWAESLETVLLLGAVEALVEQGET